MKVFARTGTVPPPRPHAYHGNGEPSRHASPRVPRGASCVTWSRVMKYAQPPRAKGCVCVIPERVCVAGLRLGTTLRRRGASEWRTVGKATYADVPK